MSYRFTSEKNKYLLIEVIEILGSCLLLSVIVVMFDYYIVIIIFIKNSNFYVQVFENLFERQRKFQKQFNNNIIRVYVFGEILYFLNQYF